MASLLRAHAEGQQAAVAVSHAKATGAAVPPQYAATTAEGGHLTAVEDALAFDDEGDAISQVLYINKKGSVALQRGGRRIRQACACPGTPTPHLSLSLLFLPTPHLSFALRLLIGWPLPMICRPLRLPAAANSGAFSGV